VGKHGAPADQESEPTNGTAAEKEPRKRPWRSRLWEWTDFGEKTLWDWLQLLSALAIPVVLAVAGFWFTAWQGERQQAIETQRANVERDVEDQRAQDTALQAYLDQMTELILEKNLRDPKVESEVRTLARARTLTVLGRLGPDRKRSVVQFLYESQLIREGNLIIDLENADLTGTDLRLDTLIEADLSEANLSGANLSDAGLFKVDLIDTKLSDANLAYATGNYAKLNFANLRGADLRGAQLSNANLNEAYMTGANLRHANLAFATLASATLLEADLRGADLSSAYLSETNLSYADLRGADLRGAQLSNTILLEADLRGANLNGAEGVTKRQLETESVKLENTIMPDGSKHD
jgi:uncharacterized protein YjbI with pentapeptide repeats